MASLITKKKGHQLYYHVVESARVDGRPASSTRPTSVPLKKVAALVKDRTTPVPISAAAREFGLPGARLSGGPPNRPSGLAGIALAGARLGPSPAH